MNEFDDLVSVRGVMMAGRFGPDGRVAEHKSKGLLLENPVALELAHESLVELARLLRQLDF